MMVGGEEWRTSEEEELDRRLHPLLRREDTRSGNGTRKVLDSIEDLKVHRIFLKRPARHFN